MTQARLEAALQLLDAHYDAFHAAAAFATPTLHPVPMDTRGWSQVLVSTLTGINGLARKKGADLEDGSDVKGANTWHAIDTPRFNGVIKAGTRASVSDKIESLDDMPHLYFVLWDETARQTSRCRIWTVRTKEDHAFRAVCNKWYDRRARGEVVSTNFQLHPPRGLDTNAFRNNCGVLDYPLLFSAERPANGVYGQAPTEVYFDDNVRLSGECKPVC